MNVIDELTEYFRKFPGVGPRQANRFVYYILKQNPSFALQLSQKINNLNKEVTICSECYQHFISKNPDDKKNENVKCEICKNPNREKNTLIIVSNDVDIKSIEKSHTYNGMYFVLGGSVPVTWDHPERIVRLKELVNRVEHIAPELDEIILALSANPEGEHTGEIIRDNLKNITDKNEIKISVLGRGLSTGTEIEYSDTETIKNALKNRF
jgi:recombination protein RecR